MKKQEYIYEGRSYTIVKVFEFEKVEYAVLYSGDRNWLSVVEKSLLVKKEDSYQYKKKLELVKEIADLEKNKEARVIEIQNKASTFRWSYSTIKF